MKASSVLSCVLTK